MNTANEHIDDLLGKLLSGEASAAEEAEAMQWVNASAENTRYLEQLRSLFEKVNTHAGAVQFDVDAAWQKVSTRITPVRKGRIVQLKSRRSVIAWRIAASVVVLLGIAFVLRQGSMPGTTEYAVQSFEDVVKDTLSDGTITILNRNTQLTFKRDPEKKTRTAILKGEAFFEISPNDKEQFIVQAEELMIRDIGTSFNVKALPESDTIEVYVKEGIVRLYTSSDKGLQLEAGETGIYIRSSKKFVEKKDTTGVAPGAYAARGLRFSNARLVDVIEQFNKHYPVTFVIESQELMECAGFSVNNIEPDEDVEILKEFLQSIFPGMIITPRNGTYILTGNCE